MKISYICSACGAAYGKWAGQCDGCQAWGTLDEQEASTGFSKSGADQLGRVVEFSGLKSTAVDTIRESTGFPELDRVFGGGLVAGSATLIGGDPGIGKSTILLQMLARMADMGKKAVYFTGEESTQQVQLRARRLGVEAAQVKLAATSVVADIVTTLKKTKPDIAVIDSVQTMYIDSIASAPGTVSQVRTSSHELIQLAKQTGIAIILVGHVTKEGQIAGPKLLEHMVDTVLYFEGDRGLPFRILRSVKNRFGAANEIGVFEMQEIGLVEVADPAALFIGGRQADTSGSVVFPAVEGSRTMMVEVQALINPSTMANPRRAVVGWDSGRLSMLLAVLQSRAGLQLADKEVYLNIAGGMKITEPAADLAVAAAIISALCNLPLPEGTVVFGEMGLSGEVRPVGYGHQRIKEAKKLGFVRAVMPAAKKPIREKGFTTETIRAISELNKILSQE